MGVKDFDYITYDMFLDFTKNINGKCEYSNGFIHLMTPTHPRHNKVQNRLYSKLDLIYGDCGVCDVYTSDVAVKFNIQEITYQFEPDVMVTCDDKFDKAVYKGIPTLVVEVLSRATRDRDLGEKLDIYEKAGINEYWIIDLQEDTLTRYYANIEGKFTKTRIYVKNETLVYKNTEIYLADIFK